MLTISEIAVTVTIWSLTATGGFFSIRAVLRSKKLKGEGKTVVTTARHKIQIHRETESIKRR